MERQSKRRKGGLRYGDVSAIARRLGLSVTHVSLVVKGRRTGSQTLQDEIERVRAERLAETEAAQVA